MIERLLKRFVAELPFRTITGPDGRPYLTRWYVWPRGPRTGYEESHEVEAPPFGVFMHYFHRSDDDRDHHNHPWDYSAALILKGGYVEERIVGGVVVKTTYKPGDVNVITRNDYHRVDLLHPDQGSWSLFVAGKNIGSWGFRDLETGEHIPEPEYNARKTRK